ncbi:Zinc finger BED domain-containing protein 1 [Merluccius polli]|uniref:Zinc finger BED domain-containing protein 1 n=1 Tax=Merluccius polli TaxID=89951 RepID=A0AA47MCT8_MERPO|nr:Zinc finger BED domain-containing protein 1 [Merluccius polli]
MSWFLNYMPAAMPVSRREWDTLQLCVSQRTVTCHFLEEYDLVSCLLDCFLFSDRHTADNLSEHLLRITREWEIQEKLVACVTDGASNITLAIQKCRWKHLHCFAHTLNLILADTTDKVKHIVDHFHRSSLSAEKLRATLAQMGLPDLKVLQDCPTRWNSTFYMLKRFVKLRDAIITTLALVNAAVSTLTDEEWEAIEEACEVLQPYEEVTVEISGEGLSASHTRTGRFKQPVVVSLLTALNAEMAKRFHRIEFNSLLSAIQRLTNAAAQATISDPSQQEALVEQGAAGGQPTGESMIWGDFDEQVSGLVSHVNAGTEATLEIRSFLQEALIPRSSNPLTWWKSRSVIYPRLTRLMMERLCVVATSVPSERVFSKMGLIISERRSRLSPSKAQQVMFLNANLK